MWKLMRAEWQYSRAVLGVTGAFCLLIAAAYCLWGGSESQAGLRAFRVLVIFCVSVVWLFQIIRRQKEAVDRLHRLLPVSQVQAGLFRVLFLTGFWGILMLFFTVGRSIPGGSAGAAALGRDVAAFSGVFLMANGISLISRDHRYTALNRFWMTVVRTMIAIFLVSGYLLFMLHGALANEMGSLMPGFDTGFRSVYRSVSGSLGILSSGLLFTWLSVYVYCRRVDYKE
ncbi:hypothetical protein JXO52_00705 [bacterium]|nr:hypothetical protein [bacterium]